jgi:hypothetical protein
MESFPVADTGNGQLYNPIIQYFPVTDTENGGAFVFLIEMLILFLS